MLPLNIILMSAWIPFAWGQSSSASRPVATLRPLNSVVSSVAASRASTVVSTSSSITSTTSSAAAARPTLQFATIDALESCDITDVTWAISGLSSDQYEISLYVIDAGSVAVASSPSVAASRSAVASSSAVTSSIIVRTSSAVAALSSASASARSTALVGRDLYIRQTQARANTTLVTGQMASRPYTFNVALPAGQYYISGSLNDALRTTARSNVFTVTRGSNTSCLVRAASSSGASGSISASRTSVTGGVMQTGAGASQGTSSSKISGGAIAGIVIGVVGGLAILAFLALCCLRKRRRQARSGGMDGDKSERFAALPSASSHDGDDPRGHGQGYPIAGAWRRNSDPDEKTIGSDDPYSQSATLNRQKALPFPGSGSGDQEVLTASDLPPSLGETRRQSGPPLTHTLNQKTSMQGIVGKEASSTESSMPHSRSSSFGATSRPPVTQQKDGNGLGRSTSTKRKPVPSLGPELRGELERERKMSEGGGGSKPSLPEPRRYSLMPDKPVFHS